MNQAKREAIKNAMQHASNLGYAFSAGWQTLEMVEKYKAKMVDDLCAALDNMDARKPARQTYEP